MALVVEDGTGLADANSYVSETDFDAYCDDRAISPTSGDVEAALVRASASLDGAYRAQYPGYRTNTRVQGLEWPRTAAYDYEGNLIPEDEIPKEVTQATCELAVRELASPGSTAPDLDRGGDIRSIRAGSVAIEYGANSTPETIYTIVDGIMASLLGSVAPSNYFGSAARG